MHKVIFNKDNIDNIKNDEKYLFDYFKTQNDSSILFLLEKLFNKYKSL
jgi:hypothetical protein